MKAIFAVMREESIALSFLSFLCPTNGSKVSFSFNQRYQKLKRCHFTLTKDLFANMSQQPAKRRQSDKLDSKNCKGRKFLKKLWCCVNGGV